MRQNSDSDMQTFRNCDVKRFENSDYSWQYYTKLEGKYLKSQDLMP